MSAEPAEQGLQLSHLFIDGQNTQGWLCCSEKAALQEHTVPLRGTSQAPLPWQ